MITTSIIQQWVNSAAFERRKFQRLKRAVQAEIRVKENEVPVRGETADISEGGCYIEMAMTLDMEADLTLVLWLGHKKVQMEAKVVTRHPQFGNGIQFGKMSEESRIKLHAFLQSAEVISSDCAVPAIPEGLIV